MSTTDNKLCQLCPLATSAQVAGFGPKDAKLIVVGEFPSNDDEATGIPFSRSKDPKREKTSGMVRNALKQMGLDPEKDVYWIHALRCSPFHHKEAKKVNKEKHIDMCRNAHLERELAEVTAPVMFVLGTHAVASILGATSGVGQNRVFPKQVVIGGHRRQVIVSYSPRVVDARTLWALDEKLNRTVRLSPRGSTPAFFKDDLRLLRAELQSRGLIPTPATNP